MYSVITYKTGAVFVNFILEATAETFAISFNYHDYYYFYYRPHILFCPCSELHTQSSFILFYFFIDLFCWGFLFLMSVLLCLCFFSALDCIQKQSYICTEDRHFKAKVQNSTVCNNFIMLFLHAKLPIIRSQALLSKRSAFI